MHDLHEITRILGFVAIGLTVCVCLYKLGAFAIRALQRTCPPPPQADARPVPERDERTGEVELQVFDGKRYRKAAGQ